MSILALGGLAVVAFFVLNGVLSILGIVISILVWMLTGYLATQISGSEGYGLLGNAALGLGGGVVGSILFRLLGVAAIGDIFLVGNIIVGVVGAVILVYAIRLLADNGSAGKQKR